MGTWQDNRLREMGSGELEPEHLWTVKQEMKAELLSEIAERTGQRLSPDTLLVGFARRAATYKRATLVLRDLQWLEPHLAAGRIQMVFSGKAHPDDTGGKAIIEEIVEIAARYPGQIVFLENYDMKLGRQLTRGCDVWLNTPTRPLEASGTSGMKSAANGGLNVSVLDGWWDEGCEDGVNGWQFGDASEGDDADETDLTALQRVFDQKVIPTFYNDRKRWISMMGQAISAAEKRFSARRMLQDYRTRMYSQP
jgi:starch phosphorylase